MINLPVINQNNKSFYDKTSSKTQIMSTMTQEVLANYKKKIGFLESENKKLSEEVKAITRNFDAISLKRIEDVNLIKRLEDEITLLKRKATPEKPSDNKDDIINNLKKNISDLSKELEFNKNKFISENKKLLEENTNVKNLLEETKKKNIIACNNKANEEMEKIKKEKDEKIDQLTKEIKNLKADLDKERSTQREIIRMNDALIKDKEKLAKDNKAMYGVLEETREKLSKEMIKNTDLASQMKAMAKIEEGSEAKFKAAVEKIKQLEKKIDELKHENEFLNLNSKTLLKEISKINKSRRGLEIVNKVATVKILSARILRTYKISNAFEIQLSSARQSNFETSSEAFSIFPIIHIPFYKVEKKIEVENYSFDFPREYTLEEKKRELMSSIKADIAKEIGSLIEMKSLPNADIEAKISAVGERAQSLRKKLLVVESNLAEIEKIKGEAQRLKRNSEYELQKMKKTYEEKLTKKRNKKYTLKNEIETLKQKIEELNRSKIDLTEINELFRKVSEITSRLKLTSETLQYSIECSNCKETKQKMYSLECGHSLCMKCIKTLTKCFECSKEISNKSDLIENRSLNNIQAKYNYVQLQIESDLALVLEIIKSYLNH